MSFPAKNTLFQFFSYGTKTGTESQRSKGLNQLSVYFFTGFTGFMTPYYPQQVGSQQTKRTEAISAMPRPKNVSAVKNS